jgi:hypothetical protein
LLLVGLLVWVAYDRPQPVPGFLFTLIGMAAGAAAFSLVAACVAGTRSFKR